MVAASSQAGAARRSSLYVGTLWHERRGARAYRFEYGVYYLCLDLDDLPGVDRRCRLLSYERPNLLSLRDADHAVTPGLGLAASVRERLIARGVELREARVSLLTNARVFGYVFNPVSFILVRGGDARLRHVVAEVHNTHGECHLYDLEREGDDDDSVYRAQAKKEFYVSPFIEMDARYEFSFRESEGRMAVRIDEYHAGELQFRAALSLAQRPLDDRHLLGALVRYPLMTLQTIALIHWNGLKLWLRGEPYRKHAPKTRAGR
ncbi:MAG: DUF1365 domain-containing protein [Dehalococcoidia bacterium]|nr:DUF1365 domain-containing protein [Dehalococcoidia bacterium]